LFGALLPTGAIGGFLGPPIADRKASEREREKEAQKCVPLFFVGAELGLFVDGGEGGV